MRVLLIGHPVSHSLSPRFQNAAFEALGLPHRYETVAVPSFERRVIAELLRRDDVLGANVTVPHKRAVVSVVDELSEAARRIGAVNTVYRAPAGRLVGHNTDVGGFDADLDRLGVGRQLAAALVLGAGGATRAVVSVLLGRTAELVVVNRTRHRAVSLLDDLALADAGNGPMVDAWVAPFPTSERPIDERLRAVAERVELVVDATSLGLGQTPESGGFAAARAALASLPWRAIPDDALAYDLKYGAESPFLSIARQRGLGAHDGLGMLVEQGALAFECWTGAAAPRDVMWRAIRRSTSQG